MSKSANEFRKEVNDWLQRTWLGQHDHWIKNGNVPVADVCSSFMTEFAQGENPWDLPNYLRALDHWPFLHLNRAIAGASHSLACNAILMPQQAQTFAVLMKASAELSVATYLFNAMLTEVRQRQTFGIALIRNQHVEFTLAELQANLLAFEAYWELAMENADQFANAEYFNLLSRDLLTNLADNYLQFSGGRGYMKGHPAEIAFREVFIE